MLACLRFAPDTLPDTRDTNPAHRGDNTVNRGCFMEAWEQGCRYANEVPTGSVHRICCTVNPKCPLCEAIGEEWFHSYPGMKDRYSNPSTTQYPSLDKNLNLLHAIPKDVCPILHLSCRGQNAMHLHSACSCVHR